MRSLAEQTYVFRPLPTQNFGGWLRYAEGGWIPDDGERDIAFVSKTSNPYPCAMGVTLPYRANILWAWHDVPIIDSESWHYMTLPIAEECDREEHLNTIAYEGAMEKCSQMYHCANGGGPSVYRDNEWIKQGLLWIKETGELVRPPEHLVCYRCADNCRLHREGRYAQTLRRLEYEVEQSKHSLEEAQKALDYWTRQLKETESRPLSDF